MLRLGVSMLRLGVSMLRLGVSMLRLGVSMLRLGVSMLRLGVSMLRLRPISTQVLAGMLLGVLFEPLRSQLLCSGDELIRQNEPTRLWI
jgi:hypothetical protein